MDIFALAERVMAMDEQSWARHANSKSVFSRISCLPLIALAIWSRVWLGWWSLIPLALAVGWTGINPRMFEQSTSTEGWAYEGVMGERFFLNRKRQEIPLHHQRFAYWLTAVSAVGVLVLGYGLYQLDIWATLCGMIITVGAKIWFVDRMVWLYQDMLKLICHTP